MQLQAPPLSILFPGPQLSCQDFDSQRQEGDGKKSRKKSSNNQQIFNYNLINPNLSLSEKPVLFFLGIINMYEIVYPGKQSLCNQQSSEESCKNPGALLYRLTQTEFGDVSAAAKPKPLRFQWKKHPLQRVTLAVPLGF